MADSAQLAYRFLDVAAFRAFLETRPLHERWELIDGDPVQSPAPRIAHQRIASNFERHLNAVLRHIRPEWRADREIGIEVSDTATYRPEPEVTVIDARTDTERSFADRFYLVMEVPSGSDRGRILANKITFYRAHPHNRFIVVADQDKMAVTVHERVDASAWAVRTLSTADETILLGDLGPICRVVEIYADTHLDPQRWP
ncbi:Uma2 family endonuclease [Methylobacterium sp. J-026]|uniref:Uma2 family endonuclease n=1 Tax=Methylobacterium sp. J-026 TaxID=2836624 RepID=UPI001FBBBDE9|nr:Uma2 family endonuclease [Methylobacterium sp. J-026]MCJ2133497.1 Uma2 family endonuclease [Methylobacterium sp. J-026]